MSAAPLPTALRSGTAFALTAFYFRRYLRRHLNALRHARWGALDLPAGAGPLVVYSNHPSWWDLALYVLLSDHLLPDHATYGPIDARMLESYRFLARIGVFGVDLDSRAGAAAFLRAGADILSRPERVMWVAAQGRFSDARDRPLALRPGLAHLAARAPDALFVPLAIEYAFWSERGAEACVAFGAPLRGAELAALPRTERAATLEAALTATLDRLSLDVRARDPARFETLIAGRAGVGGVYDFWRRARARMSGRAFDPAHAGRAGEG